jgi:hypothetical protein
MRHAFKSAIGISLNAEIIDVTCDRKQTLDSMESSRLQDHPVTAAEIALK